MIVFTCLFISVVLTLFLVDSIKWGITPTPSSKKVREKIFSILPKNINGNVADLGSGFGTLVFSLQRHLGSKQITGYEAATIPYLLSRVSYLFKGRKNIRFRKKDFLKENLSDYEVVFCYLYRSIMPQLSEKLSKELKVGSLVISHTFALDGLKLQKTVYAKDLYSTPIYIYEKIDSSFSE